MKYRRLLAVVAVGGLALAACGSDEDTDSAGTTASTKATTAETTAETSAEATAETTASTDATTTEPAADTTAPTETTTAADDEAWSKVVEAANEEGTVVVYGTLNPAAVEALPAAFNAAYPDIKLDYQRMVPADTEARLAAEMGAGQVLADVAELPSRPTIRELSTAGNVAALEFPAIDNPEFDKAAFQPTPDSFAAYLAVTAWVWNTELLPEGIDSWDDYLALEPGMLGIMPDPMISSVFTDLFASIEEAAGAGWLDEIAAADLDPLVYEGSTAGTAALAAGEYGAGFPTFLPIALQHIADGAPLEVEVYDGAWSVPTYMFGLADPVHPNAAQVYMDWFLSPDGGQKLMVEYGLGSPLPSVPSPNYGSDIELRVAKDVTPEEVEAFQKRWAGLFM